MMSKQKKKLILLAILFAVLVIAYFVVVVPLVESGESGDDTNPPETVDGEIIGLNDRYMMYPQVERESMKSLKIENEHGSYEFYLDKDGTFQLRGYEGVAYDQTKFANLVTSVGYPLAKVKVVDNASDKELKEYGLDNPRAYWTLTTTAGKSYRVAVGYDLLTGGGYYVMLEGRRSVYVLDTTLEDGVLASIEYMTSGILIAGLSQESYLTVDNFVIERSGEKFIHISQVPESERVNAQALVENVMSYPEGYYPNEDLYYEVLFAYINLTGTSVLHLMPTSEEYLVCGLPDMHDKNAAPAPYKVSFDVDGVPIILYFSEKQPNDTYNVVSSLFPEKIVAVPASSCTYLEKDLLAWLEKYPFQQWIITVSAMEIHGAGADVKFDLTHGKDEAGNNTLDVQCSTGKFIPNADVVNFRQFFRTLLSVKIEDYVPLSEDEIAALTADEKNCLLTFTITNLSGEDTVYKFYPYSGSGRRALMTVNGYGEFYVLTDLIEKIASDANKVLAGLDVNSYAKE